MFQIKLSESTAARRRIPVLLVDSTDGFTPKTGQTAPTVTISKNGATAVSGAGTFTEVGNGVYYYEFTVGEADTLGWIALNVQKATCRQYNAIIQVMAYDYAAGTNLGLSNLDASITSRPSATSIADAVLVRNIATGGDGDGSTTERTVRSALRAMRNKVAVASGVMTVYKEDDTATGWTATLSNTANVTVDPT